MKHMILILLMLAPMLSMAQENKSTVTQDTTLYVNGRKIVIREGDGKVRVKLYEQSRTNGTIENDQIFEGVYVDGQSMERRTSFNVPFAKKSKSKERRQYFEGHTQGLYLGFTRMGDELTPGLSDDIELNLAKSWEFGFNLFEGSVAISYNHCWGLTAALGWGYSSYRLDGNYAFIKEGSTTFLLPGGSISEAPAYSKSRLRYFHFRLPIALEWQKRLNSQGPLFLAFGPELEVRHGMQSRVKIDGHKKTIKGLNTRPVGVNLLLQGGFGNIGAYLRCSTGSIFEKNKGPQFYPWSFGLQWYFM